MPRRSLSCHDSSVYSESEAAKGGDFRTMAAVRSVNAASCKLRATKTVNGSYYGLSSLASATLRNIINAADATTMRSLHNLG